MRLAMEQEPDLDEARRRLIAWLDSRERASTNSAQQIEMTDKKRIKFELG